MKLFTRHMPGLRRLGLLMLLIALCGSGLIHAAPAPPADPQAQPAAQHQSFIPLIVNGAGSAASSFDLIDAAEASGKISAETALTYRVFAEFADKRLPAQFHGDDTQAPEREISAELAEKYATLSAQAQATLAPFRVPPYYAGSWWDLQRAPSVAAAPAAAPTADRCDAIGQVEQPLLNDWRYFDSGKVRVWWQTRYPEDEGNAQAFAQAADKIWENLATLMKRQPISDAGDVIPCRGGDSRLDISFVDLAPNTRGEAWPYTFDPVATPSYILLRRDVNTMTMAHELMHSFQFAYDVAGTFNEYNWWREATAKWAENYIDPKKNTEQPYAPSFLNVPGTPLQVYDDKLHQYGAYLFPYLMQLKSESPDMVRTSWEAFEHNASSLAAINSVIPNGFDKQWPAFALANWNYPPADDYRKNDGLKAQVKPQVKQELSLNGQPHLSMELDAQVQPLAATYAHLTFKDASMSTVTFVNPFADGKWPHARVQALYRLQNRGVWEQPEDWSTFGSRSFCRDKLSERVEELLIVISNSDWQGQQTLQPDTQPRLEMSNLGCRGWAGVVRYRSMLRDTADAPPGLYRSEDNLDYDTQVTFEPKPIPNWMTIPDVLYFEPSAKTQVAFHNYGYVLASDDPVLKCSYDTKGSAKLGAQASNALVIRLDTTHAYGGSGDIADTSFPWSDSCGESGTASISMDWWKMNPNDQYTVSDDGHHIKDGYAISHDDQYHIEYYEWELTALPAE